MHLFVLTALEVYIITYIIIIIHILIKQDNK